VWRTVLETRLTVMRAPPFEVSLELPGWSLLWAELAHTGGTDAALVATREQATARLRERLAEQDLTAIPAVQAVRRLFREAGCDPTRYRPASEALARRLRKGDPIPPIHPLVDLNNCLSADLLLPCCMTAAGSVKPPVVLRAGETGESYDSLRGGRFDLAGKPVLADALGPFDVPVTGSQRVKVQPDTTSALLVVYLPTGVVTPEAAAETLTSLAARAAVFEVGEVSVSA
jgi:DNA/RNA-binding domain of Phe-tRNA-synthetase-like protein